VETITVGKPTGRARIDTIVDAARRGEPKNGRPRVHTSPASGPAPRPNFVLTTPGCRQLAVTSAASTRIASKPLLIASWWLPENAV